MFCHKILLSLFGMLSFLQFHSSTISRLQTVLEFCQLPR
nr:MAG TPA: hypothetical protein [Caudoviricetes sp.]